MTTLLHWCWLVLVVQVFQGSIFKGERLVLDDVKACGLDGVCNCQSDSVDCNGRNLLNVPTSIPYNISVLNLSNNRIQTVPSTWMLQFENLINLNISINRITRAFALPSSLLYLDISFNGMKEPLKLPPHLINLMANQNHFNSFDAFFQEGCADLRRVELERNNVTHISDGLFRHCSKLIKLRLRGNHINILTNGTLKGLTAVQFLTVSFNSGSVEIAVFADPCKSLKIIIIQTSPSLLPLPVGLFKECNNLKELYIYHMSFLKILDGTFIGCSELSFLSVSNNRFISSLPGTLFDGMDCIYRLDLSSSNISKLPEQLFRKAGCISKLDLGYNHITELPDNLFSEKIHDTYQIYLYYNELKYLSEAFFRNLPNLQEIYLNSNKLQKLDEAMFLGTQLQVIYLFQNYITRIQGRPFRTGHESTVRLLYISDNPLDYVTSEAMLDFVPNANITMSCVNTTLPQNIRDINVRCVASDVPIVVKEIDGLDSSFGRGGGFTCVKGVCTSCQVGHYSNKINENCVRCPAGGFYQDQVGVVSKDFGGIACKTCNNGTFVEQGAGTSALSCNVCPEGTNKTGTAGFRACFCLMNFYRTNRFGKCFPCPNEGMNCSNDFLRIKPGFFWHWNANDSHAYKSYIKNIQTEDDSYEKAWSTYNGSIPRAYKCLVETNCINNVSDPEGNCQEGYQGWMCTVCQKGYYKLFGWCHKCHPEFVFGMMLLCTIFIAFLWFGIIKPLARNSQANGSTRRSFGDLIISRVKILFGFYQVVDSYWHSMGTLLWFASVQVAISRIIEVMSFSLSSIFVSPSCYISWFKWNPYTKLWALYATLLLTTFMLVLAYSIACLFSKLRSSGSSVIQVKTTCLKLFTFTLFASYAETCDVVFQLYNCDEFFLYEYNETPKIHLLHSHYNISCDTDIYLRYRRVFALPGWILISTFPVIMWSLLYKYSRKSFNHEMLGELQYPEWLHFMCENYKSQCWYWEILELGRKILLTFLPLAFGWEGVFIIIGLFASGLFLALHTFMRPMKDPWDNFLQFLSLLFLNFNMIVSAIHSSDNVEPVMYIIVSIMNIGIFAVLTGEAVWRTFVLLRGYSWCRCVRFVKSTNDEVEPLLSAGSIDHSDNATVVEDCR